jgi:hypothetical protein
LSDAAGLRQLNGHRRVAGRKQRARQAEVSPAQVVAFVFERLRQFEAKIAAVPAKYDRRTLARISFGKLDDPFEWMRRDAIEPALRAMKAYPQAAAALLAEPALERWHPFLIGVFAGRAPLRADMIERARKGYRGNVQIADTFVSLGVRCRDRSLVDAAADLVLLPAEGDSSWAARRVVNGYLAFGDLEQAGRIAVSLVAGNGDTGGLLDFLEDPARPAPEGALDALVGIQQSHEQATLMRIPNRLREIGRGEFADQLEARLRAEGRGIPSAFSAEEAMVRRDPYWSLDVAEERVRSTARLDRPLLFGLQLARLLERLPLDSMTAPRILMLAAEINVIPLRVAIEARVRRFLAGGTS